MAMNIVDADISALRNARTAGRARSPETVALIEAIESLSSGKAKALIPERDDTLSRLRSRLGYASRAAGVKIRVVADQNRLLFALRAGGRQAAQRGGATARREAVQKAALGIANRKGAVVSAEDVLKAMSKAGSSANVARPATMVGAVLRSMPQFERTGKNEFKFNG